MSKLFTLTFEGHVKRWYHRLPTASIHSFGQLVKELYKSFDRYDYRDVLKIINKLRMKPKESIEDFSRHFLHLCYEFPNKKTNWDFFKQKVQVLFNIVRIFNSFYN